VTLDRKRTAHVLKTAFGIVSRINRVESVDCVKYFRVGEGIALIISVTSDLYASHS
jgi:hypothetical protein